MTNEEAATWAERFWQLAGCREPFPRSLESAVAWALPLAIVKLPRLSVAELQRWVSRKGLCAHVAGSDRRLRACLLAKAGRGVVLLDGGDPDDERRFSLAHEIAHFILDYLHPRQKAVEALGEAAREVIDGHRAATLEERLTGVLRGIELGVYTHLMGRSSIGEIERIETLEAEDRADRVALELLAPRPEVLAMLRPRRVRWTGNRAFHVVEGVLRQDFGLPAGAAASYGKVLIIGRRSSRTFREWLGT